MNTTTPQLNSREVTTKDVIYYAAYAAAMDNQQLINLFTSDAVMATVICSAEWKSYDKSLANNNIRIIFNYEGGGDSGDLDSISVFDEEAEKHFYSLSQSIYNFFRLKREPEWDLHAPSVHDWWNDDGGSVERIINPFTGKIKDIYHIRYTEYETFEEYSEKPDTIPKPI